MHDQGDGQVTEQAQVVRVVQHTCPCGDMVDGAIHDADILRVSQDDVGAKQVEGGIEGRALVRQVLDLEEVGGVDDDLQTGRAQLVEQPPRLGGGIDDVGRLRLDRQPEV